MKLFNLTDVPTPTLKQYSLVNSHIVVGRELLAPGASADLTDDAVTRAGLSHYVTVGAIAVDTLPPSYVVAKEKEKAASSLVLVTPKDPVPFSKKKDK